MLLQENTPDAERTLMIRENIYVRVHGHVRAFAGKRSVVAFRVTPIADMNELTTHMLEVIYSHAYLVRGGTTMVAFVLISFVQLMWLCWRPSCCRDESVRQCLYREAGVQKRQRCFAEYFTLFEMELMYERCCRLTFFYWCVSIQSQIWNMLLCSRGYFVRLSLSPVLDY